MQGSAQRLKGVDPALYEELVEVKAATLLGCLPRAGGIEDQDPSFKETMRWLVSAGILEWVFRSPAG